MSKYPVSEMRLAIVTSLIKEVLEKIPGVPWIIASHNAVAYYNEHKEEVQRKEAQFFDDYKDSFINASYIYNHRSEINECMPTDYSLYIVYARNNNGKILGIKLSNDKTEILNTFQSQKNIIDGSVDRYNEKAEEVRKQFNLENEIEMLTTIAQLPSG
jgi:hypothetical protein